jgi:hypothetical protein
MEYAQVVEVLAFKEWVWTSWREETLGIIIIKAMLCRRTYRKLAPGGGKLL